MNFNNLSVSLSNPMFMNVAAIVFWLSFAYGFPRKSFLISNVIALATIVNVASFLTRLLKRLERSQIQETCQRAVMQDFLDRLKELRKIKQQKWCDVDDVNIINTKRNRACVNYCEYDSDDSEDDSDSESEYYYDSDENSESDSENYDENDSDDSEYLEDSDYEDSNSVSSYESESEGEEEIEDDNESHRGEDITDEDVDAWINAEKQTATENTEQPVTENTEQPVTENTEQTLVENTEQIVVDVEVRQKSESTEYVVVDK